jgi:hypothetical protein
MYNSATSPGNELILPSKVFAMISGEGGREVIRQILELAPGNKIMWSSAYSYLSILNPVLTLDLADGHWWPESFYLGSVLAREALLDVS